MDFNNIKEFEILGQVVRLKAGSVEETIKPADIVEFVSKEATEIKSASPSLDNAQVFLLAALKIAGEKLQLENEYCSNINILKKSAAEALGYIDEVKAKTH